MKLTSPVFQDGEYIPEKYTCDGNGVNPELVIGDIPAGTKSLALIVDDPDAPDGLFTHWLLYDIDAAGRIGEDSAPGNQGVNSSGMTAYGGPCPARGTHRYYFKIYALDTRLGAGDGLTREMLDVRMEGHVLDQAQLVGYYTRGPKEGRRAVEAGGVRGGSSGGEAL